jgi:hypothetical protein
MAEYIEHRAAIEAAKHAWAKGLEPSQYIEALPAADVEPVVRCRDCAHLYGSLCAACGLLLRKPDEFCSRGERKETDYE